MIRYFIHNGVAVTVLGLAIFLFGVMALVNVPIQLTPDVTEPTITVTTSYPGASPEDVEQDILIEQEEFLRNLQGLNKMTSSASLGSGTIELEFAIGSDMDEKLVRVNNALSQVSDYPENVNDPSLSTESASDQPVAWFSTRVLPDWKDRTSLYDHFDYMNDFIKTRFERVPGVSSIQGVYGGSDRQMQIYIDPTKLAEREISIAQVRDAIRNNNRDIPGGDLDEGKRRYNVRTLGRFQSPEDVENRIIDVRNGVSVRFSDIGYVRMGVGEQRTFIRHNGENAFAMGVKHQSGTNLLLVMDEVKALVDELNETELKNRGLFLTQVTDDTEYIRSSVAMVQSNIIIGGVLAFISLIVFLRNIKSTIVLGVSIPLSILGSLFLLNLAGRSINVISLAGLAFSIGAVLDSSIVVLENIYRHRSLGKDSFEAALVGTEEVWTAIFSSMMTNLVVFIPIITLQEQAGQLFRDIAIAITFANLMAFMMAVLVIPALSARLLKNVGAEPKSGFMKSAHNLFGLMGPVMALYNGIGHFLRFVLKSYVLRIGLSGGAVVTAFVLIYFLLPKTDYLPDGNQNSIFGLMIPPQGYNMKEMSAIGKNMEDRMLKYVDATVEDYEEGRIDGPPIRDYFFAAFGTQMFNFTRAKDPEMAGQVPGLLMRNFSQVPGVIPISAQRSIFSSGISGASGLDLDITGDDYGTLTYLALQTFMKINEKLPNTQARPVPGIEIGQPQLSILPKWDRMQELGISANALGLGAWVLGDGAYVDDFYEQGQKRDVYLYSTMGSLDTLSQFDTLRISTNEGVTVPIADIADIQSTVVPEQLRRVDQRRAVTLEVTPSRDRSLQDTLRIIQDEVIGELEEEGKIPPGYRIEIAGASDKLSAILGSLKGDFILAGALVYLTLVLIFKHWGHPLTIMMAIPIGLTGGVIGIHMLNGYLHTVLGVTQMQSLDVLTMLGFVILLGSIVNNPILIVEQSLNFMRTGEHEPVEAIVLATLSRIRPMLMTTVTTIFGLMPLVLIPGAGTEIYRGLGAVMFGGLFLGTITTLVFIPCVMSLFVDAGLKAMEIEHQIEDHLSGDDQHPKLNDDSSDSDKKE